MSTFWAWVLHAPPRASAPCLPSRRSQPRLSYPPPSLPPSKYSSLRAPRLVRTMAFRVSLAQRCYSCPWAITYISLSSLFGFITGQLLHCVLCAPALALHSPPCWADTSTLWWHRRAHRNGPCLCKPRRLAALSRPCSCASFQFIRMAACCMHAPPASTAAGPKPAQSGSPSIWSCWNGGWCSRLAPEAVFHVVSWCTIPTRPLLLMPSVPHTWRG